jgi:hypothetical protein
VSNVAVGESVLQQEVLQGRCIHSMSVVPTSVTGRIVIVQHSAEYMGIPETTVFRVLDDECECLGSGTELVEEQFHNE